MPQDTCVCFEFAILRSFLPTLGLVWPLGHCARTATPAVLNARWNARRSATRMGPGPYKLRVGPSKLRFSQIMAARGARGAEELLPLGPGGGIFSARARSPEPEKFAPEPEKFAP